VDESQTTFTDSGLEPETTYSYRVSAVDDEGNEGPQSDADDATTDPEPVELMDCDGTVEGLAAEATRKYETTIDQRMIEAIQAMSTYWTGWWPLLHFICDKTADQDANIAFHLTIDLIGCVSAESFNLSFLGVEDLSISESNDVIDDISSNARSLWDASMELLKNIVSTAWLIAELLALFQIPSTESIFWFTLGIAIGAYFCYLALLILHTRAFNLDPWTKAITFFFAALLLGGGVVKNLWKATSLGQGSISRFFQSKYISHPKLKKVGFQGRTHVGLMLGQLTCLITTIIIATLFYLGVL